MRNPAINFITRNIYGAWVIHGSIGFRQYYYYTKKEAMRKYREEVRETLILCKR